MLGFKGEISSNEKRLGGRVYGGLKGWLRRMNRVGRITVSAVLIAMLAPSQPPFRAPAGGDEYTITTVAGDYDLSDGPDAKAVTVFLPASVAVDDSGNLYIAEPFWSRVRKVTLDGAIGTVAGNGTQGFTGDGGAAAEASLDDPSGVAVDGSGNLYIADT